MKVYTPQQALAQALFSGTIELTFRTKSQAMRFRAKCYDAPAADRSRLRLEIHNNILRIVKPKRPLEE